MKNTTTQEPLTITNFDKKIENKTTIGVPVPQSTKHSGHSKIKGFSFQLENNTTNMINNNNKEIKNKEEELKERFQILDEENKNGKFHKNKISLTSAPSQLLSNKDGTKVESISEEISEDNSPKNSIQAKKKDESNSNNVNGNTKLTIDNPLNITDLIKEQNYVPLSKDVLKNEFEKYESARHSAKSLTIVKSFAANTHQGTVRKYNEDRVSIILNIVKPNTYKGSYWPSCSFFAVFDGHGGSKCADFLKDNLHNYVRI